MYEYHAKLLRVVDGDTVNLEIDLGMDIRHRIGVRLYGINTPEMNTAEGKAARTFLIELLTEGGRVPEPVLLIRTYKDKKEKYGRYLATIFKGTLEVNNHMIEKGHAVAYFG